MHHLLTEQEYKATFGKKMLDVTETATSVIDIWPYVESIPVADLEGHTRYEHVIEHVYRGDDGRFDHVLVITKTKNVYIVLVVDLLKPAIHGHRLLDLNREYGLPTPSH